MKLESNSPKKYETPQVKEPEKKCEGKIVVFVKTSRKIGDAVSRFKKQALQVAIVEFLNNNCYVKQILARFYVTCVYCENTWV